MLIVVDENKNITQLITVGGIPSDTTFEIPDDIDENILKNIFSYRYVNGEFVLKEDVDSEKLKKIKEQKISAMSQECNNQITLGVDWNGDHYSLTLDDQTNIGNLTLLASAGKSVPYHADGDGANCRFFTAEEFVQFSTYCQQFKVYHLTYYNQLKGYINSLTNIDDILSINYGTPLPGEYAEALSTMTGGFEYVIPIVEDKGNYNSILYDVDIDSLVFPTETPVEEVQDENSDESNSADDTTEQTESMTGETSGTTEV